MRRSACAAQSYALALLSGATHRPIACSADTSHLPLPPHSLFRRHDTIGPMRDWLRAACRAAVCRRGARGLSDSGVFTTLSLARCTLLRRPGLPWWFFTVDSPAHTCSEVHRHRATISSSWRASKMVCGASPSTSSRTWSQMPSKRTGK